MTEKKMSREDIPKLEKSERMKYEIAEELGLLDRVLEQGWRSLSAKETGRIGGLITKKNRERS
ncbi:MAG: small, acid-soluble spore protein, alpha/beta type [Lachnospiraceae bacterium]